MATLRPTRLCFIAARYEPPITQEQYEHAVDELLGTPVQVLNFCLGDGRTMLHDTQVGELWGANVEDGSHPAIGDDGWSHAIFRRAHQNAKALIDDGLDPLSVVVERAHARGMKLYPVLLVQQGSDDGVRCSTFHLEHAAEYAIEHQQGPLPDDFPENGRGCFDWTLPGVREERLAIVRETIEGYPIDGFELQMNYVPFYFHPDNVDAGRGMLTEWIAEVKSILTAARGPDAELVVRVPGLPFCDAQGLDVRAWCRDGLVDVLIAENADGNRCDPNYDFRPMVAVAAGTPCRVLASVYSYLNSDRVDQAPLPMIRAAACNAWAQGVDGIYVCQWFHMWCGLSPLQHALVPGTCVATCASLRDGVRVAAGRMTPHSTRSCARLPTPKSWRRKISRTTRSPRRTALLPPRSSGGACRCSRRRWRRTHM